MGLLARAMANARYDTSAFLQFLDGRPDERWELIDGRPLMMAGGTVNDNLIALNVARLLFSPARKSGCRVQTSDVLVSASEDADFAAFPDVFVHCGPKSGNDRILSDPTIVVEVLWPSTMSRDRGLKFEKYRAMQSVQQIILIYQDQVRIELWTRATTDDPSSADNWTLETLTRVSDVATLTSLEARLSLPDIYDDALPLTGT